MNRQIQSSCNSTGIDCRAIPLLAGQGLIVRKVRRLTRAGSPIHEWVFSMDQGLIDLYVNYFQDTSLAEFSIWPVNYMRR